MRLPRLLTMRSAGGAIVLLSVAAAALAPVVAPHAPDAVHLEQALAAPCAEYPLGTDALGRCVLSRTLDGARTSLLLAAAVVAGAAVVGAIVGGAAAQAGARADAAFSGITDFLLSLPRVIVALAAVAYAGPSLGVVVAVLVLVDWAAYARVTRAAVLSEAQKPYVVAEVAVGLSQCRILLGSLLPAALPTLAPFAALRFGQTLLAVAALGFLGLGLAPPATEWGSLVAEGRVFLRTAPWIALAPGAAMALVTLGLQLLVAGAPAARRSAA